MEISRCVWSMCNRSLWWVVVVKSITIPFVSDSCMICVFDNVCIRSENCLYQLCGEYSPFDNEIVNRKKWCYGDKSMDCVDSGEQCDSIGSVDRVTICWIKQSSIHSSNPSLHSTILFLFITHYANASHHSHSYPLPSPSFTTPSHIVPMENTSETLFYNSSTHTTNQIQWKRTDSFHLNCFDSHRIPLVFIQYHSLIALRRKMSQFITILSSLTSGVIDVM